MGRSADTWQVNRTADCDGTAGVRASSQARTRRRTSGSDATAETGFTLIEVILVVILAPMIVGAIALASITVMRGVSTTNPNSTANNVADSTDAQLISAYFTRDVQSAALITTSSSASNPAVCGSGGAMLVSFAWPATPTSEVTYWTSAGGTTLTRVYCTVSGAVATVASTATLAHGFPPTGSVGITSNTPLPVGAWSATQQYGVTLVSLSAITPRAGFQYRISALPRTASTGATGGTPIPPLLLLGSGGSLITIPGSNNTITVNGPVTLNSSSASAINEPGKNNVISSSTNTLNLLSPGGTNLSSGDTVPPTTYVTSVTDPFASLAAPAGISSIAVCTGLSTSTWTCPPGLYVTGLSVPSGTTVNFTGGGTYEFGDTLKMSGGGTVNFGGGIYVFDNGVALSGSGNTLSSTSGASGVLLYIAGGALAMPASSVSISLSAATTGTYAGILLFQSHSDCSGMQIPGSSNSVNTYGGVIYAHCTVSGKSTTLTIPGSSSGLKAGGLIVDAIQIPGSTNTVNLGS